MLCFQSLVYICILMEAAIDAKEVSKGIFGVSVVACGVTRTDSSYLTAVFWCSVCSDLTSCCSVL